jgi:hypothetical protein
MNTALLVAAAALSILVLGMLIGSGLTTSGQEARHRRQAARQRDLNLWSRHLHETARRQAVNEGRLHDRHLEQPEAWRG